MLLESILRHVFLLIWNVLWHACRGELEQRRDEVEAAMRTAKVTSKTRRWLQVSKKRCKKDPAG